MKKRIYKTVLFIELERDYFRIHRQTVECAQRLRFGRQERFWFLFGQVLLITRLKEWGYLCQFPD